MGVSTRLGAAVALSLCVGCTAAESSTGPAAAVGKPDVPGTIFTIVFENEDAENVISAENPTFYRLANENGRPYNYVSSTHPSLPNYIFMTSGSLNGITTDTDPDYNVVIPGSENLADQLDEKGVRWRAYMESMGEPCRMETFGELYNAHHDPFLYYGSMGGNRARCREKIVDFDQHFDADLASNEYRFMWISPDMCNDVHNCPVSTGDAWLAKVTEKIMASDGYKNGGAIFILFDEGNGRLFGSEAALPVIVISPNLASSPYTSSQRYDHGSYLATIEDIFAMPRLATTRSVPSLDEFFVSKGKDEGSGGDATPATH
jgi:hypothetical protein